MSRESAAAVVVDDVIDKFADPVLGVRFESCGRGVVNVNPGVTGGSTIFLVDKCGPASHLQLKD